MEANQLTNHPSSGQINVSHLTEKVGGWLSRVFGCRHKELSRPFSDQGQTYRACLSCGARRQFNLGRWTMQGDFYYSLPTTKHFRALNAFVPRQTSVGSRSSAIIPPRRQCA
jgi:hypothetical protein